MWSFSAMEWWRAVLVGAWDAFFLAAPFVLFGLWVAGLVQVLVPRSTTVRWMGGPGLGSAIRAALLGIPLPVCSCGIVPVSLALRRKGASRPALLSFLISTPESDVDAVALTWGLFGPLMAGARLVAAFLTSLVAAVLAIALPGDEAAPEEPAPHAHEHCGHTHEKDLEDDDGEERVSWAELRTSFRRWARKTLFEPLDRAGGEAGEEAGPDVRPFPRIVRSIGRHAFVELLDDVVFWLVIGIAAAGAITALVPPDLFTGRLGSGLLPMLVLLVLGVALYVCASASTPIAAALVVKGVSPGAALVFLLTGPATNVATLLLLGRHFGWRFTRIYLGSIALVALACGLALDALIAALGLEVSARLAAETTGVTAFFQLLCAVFLLALIVWRLAAGAARHGWAELAGNFQALRRLLAASWAGARGWRSRFAGSSRGLLAAGAAVLVLAWLGTGLATVPPDSRGYAVAFGRVVRRDLPPGLHWALPAPLGRLDVWRTGYPRKVDVGFTTDLSLVADRARVRGADPDEWHSPMASQGTDPEAAAYLAGDENLLEMSFAVHFVLTDPYAFFYRVDAQGGLVSLQAQSVARELVAARSLDGLLSTGRRDLEALIAHGIERRLDRLGAGVRIVSVHVVDIHPPQEAVPAFRDVSSAREDRETRIHAAREKLAREVPLARGQGVQEVSRARAEAEARVRLAAGQAEGFTARAGALSRDRSLLRDLLWRESAEKVFAGRRKLIVPPGGAGRGVTLWEDRPRDFPPGATGTREEKE